ncbi:MAG: NYN domain-containing protein [Gammaproteobacteria bacterium]|nr:NYN domain-containing protein [Gammaproteobacteria bacterium]MDX5375599.1 NYN domain-containing protein [Gammaproteobacteria bacterium]
MDKNRTSNMALFCDFENVALGVRDANYSAFSIQKVLERLLLKGNIVVKKAYCDWDRYKEFKAAMHEAAFELIEIPHVRQSGKNSADIRMVVDALDLCYTKSHVDTFVIISGDSDFSPLVSKLRENNKTVIGVGVKNSTSDLLTANCDEFIYYDDLVRDEKRPKRTKKKAAGKSSAAKPVNEEEQRRQEGLELIVATVEDLVEERGEEEKVWGSMVKQLIKRRKPGFNESYHGFRSFSDMLEEAQARKLLALRRDEKSGGYIVESVSGR